MAIEAKKKSLEIEITDALRPLHHGDPFTGRKPDLEILNNMEPGSPGSGKRKEQKNERQIFSMHSVRTMWQ